MFSTDQCFQFADIDYFIFLVLFSKTQPFRKNCDSQEKLDGIDIDDIGNLEDLLTIVFIHEECGSLKSIR